MYGRATLPATEEMLTTIPCRSFRYGRAARVSHSAPKKFTSHICRKCSQSVSSSVPRRPTPAVLTTTSPLPRVGDVRGDDQRPLFAQLGGERPQLFLRARRQRQARAFGGEQPRQRL